MKSPQLESGYTRIANELLEALARVSVPGQCRQVFDVIIRHTYGFQRKSAEITLSEFVEATGLVKQVVSRALKKLDELNMIVVDKSANVSNSVNVDKFAKGIAHKYSVQKNYEAWKLKRRFSNSVKASVDKFAKGSLAKSSKHHIKKNRLKKNSSKERGAALPAASFYMIENFKMKPSEASALVETCADELEAWRYIDICEYVMQHKTIQHPAAYLRTLIREKADEPKGYSQSTQRVLGAYLRDSSLSRSDHAESDQRETSSSESDIDQRSDEEQSDEIYHALDEDTRSAIDEAALALLKKENSVITQLLNRDENSFIVQQTLTSCRREIVASKYGRSKT